MTTYKEKQKAGVFEKDIGETYEKFSDSPTDYGEVFFRQNLYPLLEENKDYKIVDIGCGTGKNTVRLCDKVGEKGVIVGLDIIPFMIGEAKKKEEMYKNVKFYVCGAESLMEFREKLPKDIDFMVSTTCLHWVERLGGAFKTYHDLLRSGGKIIFSIVCASEYNYEYTKLKSCPEGVIPNVFSFNTRVIDIVCESMGFSDRVPIFWFQNDDIVGFAKDAGFKNIKTKKIFCPARFSGKTEEELIEQGVNSFSTWCAVLNDRKEDQRKVLREVMLRLVEFGKTKDDGKGATPTVMHEGRRRRLLTLVKDENGVTLHFIYEMLEIVAEK